MRPIHYIFIFGCALPYDSNQTIVHQSINNSINNVFYVEEIELFLGEKNIRIQPANK